MINLFQDLEYQLANPVKFNKLKDEFEELGKANKLLKVILLSIKNLSLNQLLFPSVSLSALPL